MVRFLCLLLVFVGLPAQSQYLESDFADSEFSIKGRAHDFAVASSRALDGRTYIAQVEVLDVYYGDINVGDKIELIIMADDILKSLNRDRILEGEFATSFCKSRHGIYFTSRLYRPREKTFAKLKQYREEGTDYWDSHDCAELRGSRMDPDALDYEPPVLNNGGNHSAKYWKRHSTFMKAYSKAIENTVNPYWVSEFDGIGRSRETYELNEQAWLHISFCQYDNCKLHNMNILFNESDSKAVAIIADESTYFVGQPSDEMKSLLLSLNDTVFSTTGSIEKRLYNKDYYSKLVETEKNRKENRSNTEKLIGSLINIYIED